MSDVSTHSSRHDTNTCGKVRVWDPLVRIFHWSLVGGFAVSYITAEEWDAVHEFAGYVVAGLIGFRLIWGLIGSRHARFSDFTYRPSAVVSFIKDSLAMKGQRYVGHNPAGGAMVIALLLAISGIAATGYMMTLDMFWGVEWVEDIHELLVNGTLVLIVLHVGGVILASIEHKENLIRSMFTGLKRR